MRVCVRALACVRVRVRACVHVRVRACARVCPRRRACLRARGRCRVVLLCVCVRACARARAWVHVRGVLVGKSASATGAGTLLESLRADKRVCVVINDTLMDNHQVAFPCHAQTHPSPSTRVAAIALRP